MTPAEFKAANRLDDYIRKCGAKLHGSGSSQITNRCPKIQHKDKHLCVTVDVDKQLWHCNDCGDGGDILTWMAIASNRTNAEVVKEVCGNGFVPVPIPAATIETGNEPKYETVATYDYLNAAGDLVYQVVRQQAQSTDKPSGYVKTFRQRRPDDSGGWIYNMEGVERVLYRLPEIIKAKTVWVVEGEKDADRLVRLGFVATCNVSGAGKWLQAYSETLAKKVVAICGDNDEAGQEHVKKVFDSLAGKAKSVRVVRLPKEYKDVSDYADSFKTDELAKAALFGLFDFAAPCVRGVSLPVFKVSELEDQYRRHVNRIDSTSLNLSRWIPSLKTIRPLVPGEVALLLGATGIGKTAALSNIALHSWPLPTLFFELELPPELMFERILALKTKISCMDIERAYKTGDELGEEAIDKKLSHLHICTQPKLKVEDIERIIVQSELKIGERPKVVLIDYIGLVAGLGKSRYERVSAVAEDLKVIAKSTQTVIVMASQVNRASTSENPEITLESGKDSGSLENSSGLVIGLWRDANEGMMGTIKLRILKSTKGGASKEAIVCNYDLNTLAITERSKIEDIDVPNTPYRD